MVVLVFINSSSFGISSIGRSNIDPLFVYALLLDENNPSQPVFTPAVDHIQSKSIVMLPPGILQQIVDAMVAIYAELTEVGPPEFVQVKYLGGAVVSLPAWLLQCDMKKLIEPLRRRLNVNWNPDFLIRKYEVLRVVPVELAAILTQIQRA